MSNKYVSTNKYHSSLFDSCEGTEKKTVTGFHLVNSTAAVIILVANYVNTDYFQCFRLWP